MNTKCCWSSINFLQRKKRLMFRSTSILRPSWEFRRQIGIILKFVMTYQLWLELKKFWSWFNCGRGGEISNRSKLLRLSNNIVTWSGFTNFFLFESKVVKVPNKVRGFVVRNFVAQLSSLKLRRSQWIRNANQLISKNQSSSSSLFGLLAANF